jgi:hypothetical protein
MSLADFIPEKFLELFSDPDFSKAIKGYNLYLIKEDPEYRAEVKTYFDVCLATSELKPIKRIAELETVTGLNDFADFEDEDREPNLQEQIKELSCRIDANPQERIKIDLPVIPETTLEHKASALIEHLIEKVKPRNNAVFMNSNEIFNFLKCELPEDLRLKEDIRNPRQAKKDILEKAVKLFSNSVMIIKNKSGNKVTGIALKPSAKCRYTDTC